MSLLRYAPLVPFLALLVMMSAQAIQQKNWRNDCKAAGGTYHRAERICALSSMAGAR